MASNKHLIHLPVSLAPAETCRLSRWWTWADVFWWTGCRTTSRARLSITSWTSMCTPTPSTCVVTARATTTLKAASEGTRSCLPVGNRYDCSFFNIILCKASECSKPNDKLSDDRSVWWGVYCDILISDLYHIQPLSFLFPCAERDSTIEDL